MAYRLLCISFPKKLTWYHIVETVQGYAETPGALKEEVIETPRSVDVEIEPGDVSEIHIFPENTMTNIIRFDGFEDE